MSPLKSEPRGVPYRFAAKIPCYPGHLRQGARGWLRSKFAQEKRPRHGRHAGTARVTADRGVGKGTHAGPVEVLALRYELGCFFAAIVRGLLQALVLCLRIADGFCQHLAQLSLGLCGFPLGWLPLGHKRYVGMPEGELNPCCARLHVRFCEHNGLKSDIHDR